MINLKRGDNMTSIFSLNKDLLNRYKTIINNIKSPSPTFYDAYNEFIECLLKAKANQQSLVH